jgi:aminoacrylate hydrolase
MPKAKLEKGEIYYEVHGEGEPLLLVPGLGGTGAYWMPNLPALSKHYRVIVHDHRGTGQSSRSKIRYSVDQMTADLVGLLDHLEIERAHLVGHSTGGAIGQTLAATQPDRLLSMLLYATWTKADAFFRRVFEARRALLTEVGVPAYVRSTAFFLYPDWWINANIEALETREEQVIAGFPSPEIGANRIDAIVAFDRTKDLANIDIPTLVLCARDDFLTPPYFSKALAEAIPNARLHLLEKGGHCASETVLDSFNEAVLAFLASIETSQSP